MNLRRLLAVLCLFGWMLAAPAPPAQACSCAPIDARDGLVSAEAAFVGTTAANDQSTVTFKVEKVVKGDLGDTVTIGVDQCFSPGPEPGVRVGLLLRRWEGHWTAGCGQVPPDNLLRAAGPFPEPDGVGPPAVIVGSTYGPGRLVSLDRSGRPIAFGDGDGQSQALAFCPGGRRFAETWYSHEAHSPALGLWDVETMELVWSRPLAWAAGDQPSTSVEIEDVACVDEAGDEVRFISLDRTYRSSDGSDPNAWRYGTIRVRAQGHEGPATVLWEGEGTHGAVSADGALAYVSGTPRGLELVRVDLSRSGRAAAEVVGELPPGMGQMSLSPDGERVAGIADNRPWEMTEGYPVQKRVVVDSRSGKTFTADMTRDESGQMVWLDDERVAFVPGWGEAPVLVYDAELHLRSSWPGLTAGWWSQPPLAVDGQLLALHKGLVRSGAADGGPAGDWALLEDAVPYAMAAVPGAVIDPAGNAAPVTSTTTTVPPDDSVEVAQPASGGGGGGGRLVLAGGAAAALLATAGATVAWRRRRLPTDLI